MNNKFKFRSSPKDVANAAYTVCMTHGVDTAYILDSPFGLFIFDSNKAAFEAVLKAYRVFIKSAALSAPEREAVKDYINNNLVCYKIGDGEPCEECVLGMAAADEADLSEFVCNCGSLYYEVQTENEADCTR